MWWKEESEKVSLSKYQEGSVTRQGKYAHGSMWSQKLFLLSFNTYFGSLQAGLK